MAFNADAITALYDALQSNALTLGVFDSVDDHEPVNPPGKGLTAALMMGDLGPAPHGSGLASTSARLEFAIRIYGPRLKTPRSNVDRDLLAATVLLIGQYSADFELVNVPDGLVRCIDLLGAYGEPVNAKPGWLTQDGSPYRVQEITVPLILNDVWPQGV
jgi:hypothetical protein